MSVVGLAPWDTLNRKVMRAPVNPLDKSTVVSIYPREINEVKHTIQPGRFHVDPGTYTKPAILIVGPSSWWRDLDEGQPMLEIPNSSIQIADSVVRDYANGLLACNMSDMMPGLFYVPGCKTTKEGADSVDITRAWIQSEYKHLLDKALANQKRWYQELVNVGDVLWARTQGNPLSISDDMRLAAQELNLKEKPWLMDFTTVAMVNCKYCGTMVRPGFPICSNCHHVVDEIAYKAMNPTKDK